MSYKLRLDEPLGYTLAMQSRLCVTATLTLLALLPSAGLAASTELKIATAAPRGSAWMRLFRKMKARVAKETDGAVKLRFYPGQVQGDERDVVRKMRTGQLDGGGLTATGLSLINSSVLVLQMPTLFRSDQELDRVRDQLDRELRQTFLKRGFVLLGWADLGAIYMYSSRRIKNLAELRRCKVWAWSDDHGARAVLKAVKISPRVLGLPQVLPALNTGMVDTVFSSPLGLLALQWHSRLKYIIVPHISLGVGATVLAKAAFNKLSKAHQDKLLAISVKYHRALTKRVRRDNQRAFKVLQRDFGFVTLRVPPDDWTTVVKAADSVIRSFVPRYYPKALLDRVFAIRRAKGRQGDAAAKVSAK